MLLIVLHYHVMLLLKERVIFVLVSSSSLTRNLSFGICSPVDILVHFKGTEIVEMRILNFLQHNL